MMKITLPVGGQDRDFSESELTKIVENHFTNQTDTMKITLPVGGRERTFSKSELIEIVEKHFANQKEEKKTTPIAIQGIWFEVNPKGINQELFSKKRNDKRQEWTRWIILEAFTKVSQEPEKYGIPFKTLIPERTWPPGSIKGIKDVQEIANKLGDHMANWVEQALEWAQRIANGETWEKVCNKPDMTKWYRLVIWKDGCARLVGASQMDDFFLPASYVELKNDTPRYRFNIAVPLVVFYGNHCPL